MNQIVPDHDTWQTIAALAKGVDASTPETVIRRLISSGFISEEHELTQEGIAAQENAKRAIRLAETLSSVGKGL